MKHRPDASQSQQGFTLSEILAVLVVLSVVGLVALSKMSHRDRADATSGLARQIYTRMVQARFTAITSGARVKVHLLPAGQTGLSSGVVLELHPALLPGMSPATSGSGDPFGPATDQVTGLSAARILAVTRTVDFVSSCPGACTALAVPVDVIFYPDGSITLVDQDGSTARGGATVYVADDLGGHLRRVLVMGRTGFARMLDS